MRYFLAIPLPEEVKQKLHAFNVSLSKFKGLRLVSPDNMHLTLLFLGNNGVGGRVEALKKIKFSPFTLKTAKVSLFPEEGAFRLVWVDLKKSKELEDLQKKVSSHFDITKDYRPHITLARVRRLDKSEKRKLSKLVEDFNFPSLSIEVKNFKLYSSELTVLGPVHRVVEYFGASSERGESSRVVSFKKLKI